MPHRRISGTDDKRAPLVLGLHGMGMNEAIFARQIRPLFTLPAHFLLARGPISLDPTDPEPTNQEPTRSALTSAEPTSSTPAKTGSTRSKPTRSDSENVRASWYHYDGDQEGFKAELRRCEEYLRRFLTEVELQYQIQPSVRFLLGFSQGGYCGAVVALRNPNLFRGMIISGARVKTEILKQEIATAAKTGFTALLCHGRDDTSVDPSASTRSRDALIAGGIDVQHEEFHGGHRISQAQLTVIHDWLATRLPGR